MLTRMLSLVNVCGLPALSRMHTAGEGRRQVGLHGMSLSISSYNHSLTNHMIKDDRDKDGV